MDVRDFWSSVAQRLMCCCLRSFSLLLLYEWNRHEKLLLVFSVDTKPANQERVLQVSVCCPLQVPVAHCFGPAGQKKRFCCVCRKQTEGSTALRCEGGTSSAWSIITSQTSSTCWYNQYGDFRALMGIKSSNVAGLRWLTPCWETLCRRPGLQQPGFD